jgi:AmmeMemoRadiSam system protein A
MFLSEDEKRLALAMARRTLVVYLEEGRIPSRDELWVPGEGVFLENRAVFVTLKESGALRGCIGHIVPVEPLWMSIRANAIAAATRDPRFPKVISREVAELKIEVSVLTPPREIEGPEKFEVGKHGIILELGGYSAVFLPQVAPEQGWDADTTLSYLSMKAGLAPDGWRNPRARFRVFEAEVFGEDCGPGLGHCDTPMSV